MKPTQIGVNPTALAMEPESQKPPTSIGGAVQEPRRPTAVIGSAAKTGEQAPVERWAPVVAAGAPTALGAKLPHDCFVTPESVKAMFPSHDRQCIDEIVGVAVKYVNADSTAHMEELGKDTQVAFNDLLTELVEESSAALWSATVRHLERVHTLLADLTGQLSNDKQRWFGRKQAGKAEVTRTQEEVHDILDLLKQGEGSVQASRSRYSELRRQLECTRTRIDVDVMAASWLAEHARDHLKPNALSRGLSLAETASLIRTQIALSEAEASKMDLLAQRAHELTYVQFPRFIQTVAAIPDGPLNETQRYVVSSAIDAVIHHLR